MRRVRTIGWRGIALAGLLLLAGHPAATEPLDRVQAALLSGSTRLAGFALMRDRPAGGGPLLARLMQAEGMLHDGRDGPVLLWRGVSVRPVLRWDDNINGGIAGDTISVGGLDLTVDAASRARGGLVVGAAASVGARYRLAPGRMMRLSAQAMAVHAPRHELWRGEAAAEACIAQALPGWRFLDACAGHSLARSDLSDANLSWAGLRGTGHFEAAGGLHALSLGLRQTWRDDYAQGLLDLSLDSALPRIGALGLHLSVGEAVAGHNAIRYRAGASLTRRVAGRRVSLGLDWQREEGSAVFGTPRRDALHTLGVEVELSPRLTLRLAGQRRSSTIAMYDENRLILDIGWHPRR